jgi:geranylgeranyl reductase family protein
MTRSYDVIVIGAGPSGSSAAYFLARQGLKVLVLDKSEFPRDKPCGDVLTPRALSVLQEMDILDEIRRIAWKLGRLLVTAPSGKTVELLIPPLPHAPSYVLAIPRLRLDNIVRERALRNGAKSIGHAHVINVIHTGGKVTVTTDSGSAYESRVVIIAIGASTKLLSTLRLYQQHQSMALVARTYFEDIGNLNNCLHFCFSGVTFPGYGWIFPLSESAANIGTGVLSHSRSSAASSPRKAFDTFVQTPLMKSLLQGAAQVAPLKSYPLRMDFPQALTFGNRMLLVGEAAGLVNPLTGDGIDYGLESGRTAAKHVTIMFETGDFSRERFAAYDAELRGMYQNLFLFCEQVRKYAFHRPMLNILVPTAERFPNLASLLTRIVLGGKHVHHLTLLRLVRELYAQRLHLTE